MPDYAGMSLHEELETRFADAERRRQEEEFLSRGWQPPARWQRTADSVKPDFAGIGNGITKSFSEVTLGGLYLLGETLGAAYPVYKNLRLRQEQMGRQNLIDGDNYYHRLGMHDAGTLGLSGALAGFAGGLAKEGYDLYSKSLKGDMPWRESLSDSYKDMKNNIEGLFRGLTHPDENGINWLKNLDIKTNTWKKYE